MIDKLLAIITIFACCIAYYSMMKTAVILGGINPPRCPNCGERYATELIAYYRVPFKVKVWHCIMCNEEFETSKLKRKEAPDESND